MLKDTIKRHGGTGNEKLEPWRFNNYNCKSPDS